MLNGNIKREKLLKLEQIYLYEFSTSLNIQKKTEYSQLGFKLMKPLVLRWGY